jgi:hypothetical protein
MRIQNEGQTKLIGFVGGNGITSTEPQFIEALQAIETALWDYAHNPSEATELRVMRLWPNLSEIPDRICVYLQYDNSSEDGLEVWNFTGQKAYLMSLDLYSDMQYVIEALTTICRAIYTVLEQNQSRLALNERWGQ